MISSSDYNLIAFKAISTFTTQLNEMFGSDKNNHSLKLYERLICKTSISHDKAINKHIDIFREFCIKNRDALIAKDIKIFVSYKVEYSSNVFIDFNNIFKKADRETTEVIWKHLLTLSALLDPAGNAKEILKNSVDTKEADFLTDIINKVETHVSPNSNPMDAVSSIMSSGVFNDLISGMNSGIQDGSLDLGKLMGSVQKMCTSLNVGSTANSTTNSTISSTEDSAEKSSELPNDGINMITKLMSSMGGNNGSSPDMSQFVSMLGPMLSSMNNTSSNISPVLEKSIANITEDDE